MKRVTIISTVFLLSSFIILFVSCKKDAIRKENKSNYQFIKKISNINIQKNKRLLSVINTINTKNLNFSINNKNNDLFNFIILTNEANLYIDNNNYQYTFSVYRENPIDTIQENVLLTIKPNQIAEAYLFRYHLTELEFQQFINNQYQGNPIVDIIPIDYDSFFNKSCMISYEPVFNILYSDGCCTVIQYVGVNVSFTGDCGGSGAFSTINDFGNGYIGPPEGGGGVPLGFTNIQNYFNPNGILGLSQQQSDWINQNPILKIDLISYLSQHYFTQSALEFVKYAIDAIMNGYVSNLQELLNQEFAENDQIDYDLNFWNNYNSQPQSLPSYNDFNNAYPRNMNASDVFSLIGGDLYNLSISNGWGNACAARVSRALNYSGVNIPNIPGKTFKGSDNKFYFVSAIKLYRWMIAVFGQPDISLTGIQAGNDGQGFFSQANSQPGIYLLIPNYPVLFGASGHADIFDGNNFDGHGYFNARGGVHSINLWFLN